MAMDRKNKKAAQTAAAAAAPGSAKGSKGGKKDASASGPGNKLPLLAGGSTAPTRILNSSSSGSSKSGRPPINMALKATISPSAPAPALKDTDFASFATLDDLEGLQQQTYTLQNTDESSSAVSSKKSDSPVELSKPLPTMHSATEPVPLPLSAPRSSGITNTNDFGPIGSPPNYRTGQASGRVNGTTFSPATSPRNYSNLANLGSPPSHNVPLSAPGTQDHFVSSSYTTRGPGIAASLGSGIAMMGGRRGFDNPAADMGPNSFSGLLSMQLSSSVSQGSGVNGLTGGTRAEYDISIEYDDFSGIKRKSQKDMESAVEEEGLGDFLPSSLNDLLTPEERSRRMSRSNSGAKPPGFSHLTSAFASVNQGSDETGPRASTGLTPDVAPTGNGNSTLGHRYSRSVPAPTLLGDIKSIWADAFVDQMPSSPHRGEVLSGTLSSALRSNNVQADEVSLSMSIGSAGGTPSSLGMISPSNASAAFLPGLHRHYLDAKAKQAQQAQLGHTGIGRGIRGASNPLFANTATNSTSSLAGGYLQPLGSVGLPSSVSSPSGLHTHVHGNISTTYRTTPSPFDLTQKLHQPQPHNARPIPNLSPQVSKLDDPLLPPTVLSPSSRALQNHAPGQSLPQGLAAGYSRIHALPPLTNITSPPSGSFVAGSSPSAAAVIGNNSEGPFGEWPSASTQGSGVGASGPIQHNTGRDSMFSRLTYSVAAARSSSGHPGAPPGLSRNISGGRYQPSVGPLRNGPVMTRDDDILFDMDK